MYFSKFASLAVFASLTTSILAAPKPFPQAASPVAGDGPGKPDRYEQPGGAAQREDLRAKGGDLLGITSTLKGNFRPMLMRQYLQTMRLPHKKSKGLIL